MGGSSGGGKTNTIEKSDPWVGQQPYLGDIFSNAQQMYQAGGPQYYQGQTVADLSPYTQSAVDLTAQRALNGSPVTSAAQSETLNTLNGQYLGQSNPYLTATLNGDYLDPTKNTALNAIVDRNAGDITSRVMSQFGAAGRTGSGINQQVLERELGDNANQLYGQQYANERNNMMQANSLYSNDYNSERSRMAQSLALAPQTAGMDYTDLQQLGNAGSVLDTQNQNLINADVSRWDYNQNLPKNMLDWYSGLVQGNNWGGSSSASATNVAKTNPWLSTAGGAAAGYATGASLGSTYGPYGALIGAGLGYLASR